MTDHMNSSTSLGTALIAEKQKHGDIEFQYLSGGVEFGKRFLYHLVWAKQNYIFDYFLRMDDDYFFCLDVFLHQLPMPPKLFYHWGYLHCVENLVRPEESMILFSKDIIDLFLRQDPDKMLCHPWADQEIGIWKKELNLKDFYHTDIRLHHHPPASYIKKFQSMSNICHSYIGVHGTYHEHMRVFWEKRGDVSLTLSNDDRTLDNFFGSCTLKQTMDWKGFGSSYWRYPPKRCIDNPTWDTSTQMGGRKFYEGREGGQN